MKRFAGPSLETSANLFTFGSSPVTVYFYFVSTQYADSCTWVILLKFATLFAFAVSRTKFCHLRSDFFRVIPLVFVTHAYKCFARKCSYFAEKFLLWSQALGWSWILWHRVKGREWWVGLKSVIHFAISYQNVPFSFVLWTLTQLTFFFRQRKMLTECSGIYHVSVPCD